MPFWELSVPAPAEIAEGLTNFLWEQGALGVVEEETPASLPRLRAFYPETTSSTALSGAVSAYLASLRALGLAADVREPQVRALLDEPWAEAWRQAFSPQRVGRRLLIVPPWERAVPANGRRTLIIEPGRAFGTGSHGSTQGCLVLLEALLDRGPVTRALDIGTGTGILAIAAAALGVPRVLALDTDPDAVAAARANAALNGVAEGIEFRLAETTEVEGPAFPLVLTNLLAGSHLKLAREYRRLVSPGGHLILGGILADEATGVREVLGGHGFAFAGEVEIEGWVSLGLTR